MLNNKKNVLITGASSGIGEKIKEVLDSDYNLFLTGRRKLDIENYFSCDLSNTNEIYELYNQAKKYFNSINNHSIDILINCAGQYIYKKIEDMEENEISNMIDLNFKSGYILSSLVIPDMKKNLWGRIVNIGSISGMVGEGYATLYSATKGALSSFTKALALEVASYNITINQVNPGWVKTPLVDRNLDESDKKEVIDVTPQNRFIEPIEVASLVKDLLKEELKGLTGQNINLCAGLSIG